MYGQESCESDAANWSLRVREEAKHLEELGGRGLGGCHRFKFFLEVGLDF